MAFSVGGKRIRQTKASGSMCQKSRELELLFLVCMYECVCLCVRIYMCGGGMCTHVEGHIHAYVTGDQRTALGIILRNAFVLL